MKLVKVDKGKRLFREFWKSYLAVQQLSSSKSNERFPGRTEVSLSYLLI